MSQKMYSKDFTSENVEVLDQLHRYFMIFMMLLIIMISMSTAIIYLQGEIVTEVNIIFFISKLSLVCGISFIILLCCYFVDDSSTFVFLAMFNLIAFAVMNAFAGATLFGIFNQEVILEFSHEIWYKSEMSRNINGATLTLMNLVVQVVFACYLAPTFTYYMKHILVQKENLEMWDLKKEHSFDDNPRYSGKIYDHFQERRTLRRDFTAGPPKEQLRFLRVFGSLEMDKKPTIQFAQETKKTKFASFKV